MICDLTCPHPFEPADSEHCRCSGAQARESLVKQGPALGQISPMSSVVQVLMR